MLHRCRDLSRDATSPESLRLVKSTKILPDDFLTVASKADRTQYYTESNSLLPRAGVRDAKGDAPARENRLRWRSRCIRRSVAVFCEPCNTRKPKAALRCYN